MTLYRSPYEAYPFLSDADGDLRCDYEILTDLAAAPASLAYEPLPGIPESVLTAAPDLDFGASALEAAAPEGWMRGMPALA